MNRPKKNRKIDRWHNQNGHVWDHRNSKEEKSSGESLDAVYPTQKIVHDADFYEYVQQAIRSAELLYENSLLQTDLSKNDISDQ